MILPRLLGTVIAVEDDPRPFDRGWLDKAPRRNRLINSESAWLSMWDTAPRLSGLMTAGGLSHGEQSRKPFSRGSEDGEMTTIATEHEAPGPKPPRHEPGDANGRAGRAPGAAGSCLRLALPLVVSQSFMTIQVFIDTFLLAHHDPLEMAASFPAVMWYWVPFSLLQVTSGYVSTFVAQYVERVVPIGLGPPSGREFTSP